MVTLPGCAKKKDNPFMIQFSLFRNILRARFLRRPNRFLAQCQWQGKTLSAFLPNSGRLQELLLPGCMVYLIKNEKLKNKKTNYTAVAIEKDGHPIILHTLCANQVVRHLLEQRKIPGLKNAVVVKTEIKIGKSRFDFLLREGAENILLEVKSCTQFGRRVAMFPDAITKRGTQHLKELLRMSEEGIRPILLILIHWPFAKIFIPDYHTDLEFSQTFLSCRDRVEIIPVSVSWRKDLSLSPKIKILKIPWDLIEKEAKDRGTYLLILHLKRSRKVRIGKLGEVYFNKGFYIYVGSAMLNLTKRMERHRRLRKRHHWHIDELRAVAEFHSLLAIRSSDRLECEIAKALSRTTEWSILDFGSTDCSCHSHLFGISKDPIQSKPFHQLLQYFRMDRLAYRISFSKQLTFP